MTNTASTSRSTTTKSTRSRAVLLLVGAVVGAIGYEVFLYLHAAWERGEKVPYAEMAEHRDTWLTAHFWLGPLMGLGFIVLGLAVANLLRRRGAIWGTIAGTLLTIGGLGFAAGLAGEGLLSYAATSDALDPATGAALLEHLQNTEPYFPIFGIGLAGVSLGCVVAAIGLIVGKVVPLWVPILLVIGVVGMSVAPHAWWVTSPLQIASVAIAWYGARAGEAGH